MRYIETEKFSDVYVSCKTLLPFERKTITALNVLVYMLKAKSEKFDTKQKLADVLNRTYGMKVLYGMTSYGNQVCLDVRFRFIRPDWIEDPYYVDSVKAIMEEMLMHPVLDEDNFLEAKYLLKNRLLAQQDDPASVCCLEAFQMAHEKHSISIPVQGCLEDLTLLSLKDVFDVYALYMEMSRHVFVCGKLNDVLYSFLDDFDSHYAFLSSRTLLPRRDVSYKKIKKDIAQTCIAQVYATGIDLSDDNYYALLVFNQILGAAQKNVLFDVVREQNSLCYSISSTLIRFDGALLISTGCSLEDVNRVLILIDEVMDHLLNMDFDSKYLEIAKMGLKDQIISNLDHPQSMIEQQFLNDLLHRKLSYEDMIDRIYEVTMEDISSVALSLRMVSCAVLEESGHEV